MPNVSDLVQVEHPEILAETGEVHGYFWYLSRRISEIEQDGITVSISGLYEIVYGLSISNTIRGRI